MAEMTEVSDAPADGTTVNDRVPELIALASFLGVVLIGVALVLIEFKLPATVQTALPWVGLAAIGLYFRFAVPSAKLAPARRLQRDERRAGAIIGILSGLTVLGGITAATFLTSWSQWLVFGSFFAVALGVGLLLHVRFTIGP